ncbi:MAG: helix-turn-helix transcriptional regulator [Leuconostoc pseudomesenteroides]|uniref:helix-turn-helix domain-containing protein n=1 Tax=Leuconostoc pseudomesenteroides TaxID=33968 RepID=UPI001E46194A|nr:helix-turn-helix transcriptional regulator [Leuconostoc pseudomesenteroides]MCC7669040.1 XRE family transcriptional regulator [Leuconostoc pseudomesenteroides]
MIDYGATFKRLREDKGLKIVDLEQPNISRSLIGKFESGQTRMSADRLDKLLADMGVSHDEFLFLGGDRSDNYIYMKLHEMGVQTGEPKEMQQLEAMITRSTNDLKHGRGGIGARFMREFGLMLKYGIDKETNEQFYNRVEVKKHVKPAVDFLKQAETWGRIELDIFTLFYPGMSPTDLLTLGRLAIKRAHFYSQLRTEQMRLVDIIYTAFNGLIYADIAGAAEMLDLEESVMNGMDEFMTDLTTQRLRLIYSKGLLKMLQGDVEGGYTQAMSVVPAYEIAGMNKMSKFVNERAKLTRKEILAGNPGNIPHTYSMLI